MEENLEALDGTQTRILGIVVIAVHLLVQIQVMSELRRTRENLGGFLRTIRNASVVGLKLKRHTLTGVRCG